MNTPQPVKVFYDASCAICAQEMQQFKRCDQHNQLQLIDCSSPRFSLAQYHIANMTQTRMMSEMHVQRADGSWLKGAAAVEFLYRLMGFTRIANLWQRRWIQRCYPWIANHRQWLSRIGLDKLWMMMLKRSAKRIQARMQACHNGQCEL